MKSTNHKCIVCGTEYLYCDDCGEYGSYKTVCCCEEHYKIFLIVKKYLANKNKSTALAALDGMNFDKSKISTLVPSIQPALEEIYTAKVIEEKEEESEETSYTPKHTYTNSKKAHK